MAPCVLFVPETWPPEPGGVARSAERQAALFAGAGARVVVFAREAGPLGREVVEAAGGIEVVRFGRGEDEAQGLLAASEALERHARRARADLVHAHSLAMGWLVTVVARRRGLPSLVSVRGNDLDRDVFDPRRMAWRLEALRAAGAVTAVSRELAARVRSLVPRDVVTVPNSVDPAFFRPGAAPGVRGRLGAREGEALLGFAGEARGKKGTPELVAAVERLPGVRLVLAGGARDEVRPLLAGVTALPYLDQEDLRAFYRAVDLVVLPSRSEGMPNVLLEAMACGRPVAARLVGGVADVAAEGRGPTLWPLGSRGTGAVLEPSELARGLEAALRAPASERAVRGRRGRVLVVRHHGPERELEGYRAVWSSLLR